MGESEFDKWWNEDRYYDSTYGFAKAAWNAALEHAAKLCAMQKFNTTAIACANAIRKEIA